MGTRMISIRRETSDDIEAIRHVNRAAFGRPHEAALVDALRAAGGLTLSLVAVDRRAVVGHVAFSPVTIESECSVFAAVGLAPMAVLPALQRQGVGTELIRRGLEECRQLGQPIVVVLGHPDYYPRFGFEPAGRHGLRCSFDAPAEAFMVAELLAGALAGRRGIVRYRPEFDSV